ncbi:MAG: T9SS type A sorting domain-containing protein [Candidatus Celaenobacter antarcticus]|nr:T9SS type A sorting domain-containing protein [Candidatus Celaenobacter antarcticus]MDP8315009.1 T9SS type A sorting domain-containing protein [Candidatus Celaenobacter antarcticus]
MKKKFFLSVFSLLCAGIVNAAILNVPADFTTIQIGINSSVNGDTVLVQPGTYVENINYDGKNITVASLFLTTADTSYISQTVIDPCQHCFVVTFQNGEDSTSVLYGLTITNSGGFSKGIVCINSSPKLDSNSIMDISSNCVTYDGGGICLVNSNAIIINNLIQNNHITVYEPQQGGGSGISSTSSSPYILNNLILENTLYAETIGSGYGAGIYCKNSNPVIIGNTIHENIMNGGSIFGAGIYVEYCNPIYIYNNIISYNYSNVGAGIYISYSSGEIKNNFVFNNYTSEGGYGGRLCIRSENIKIINNIICNNSSGRGGGLESRTNIFINNTICNNYATNQGGAVYGSGRSPIFYNNIMFGNNSVIGSQVSLPDGYYSSDPEFYFNNIEGGLNAMHGNNTYTWIYQNNIDLPPNFVNPTAGSGYEYCAFQSDWSLTEYSPCIDVGTPDTTGLNIPPWDMDGNIRVWDGNGSGVAIIDMGAYEYGAPSYSVQEPEIPQERIIYNFPNPTKTSTTIKYFLKQNSHVKISIYNLKGQLVETIINDAKPKGEHAVLYNTDTLNSGVYFYKIQTEDMSEIKKMIVIK